MKHTPKSCLVPKLELLTTPNKNIQSQFMRTDVSYYVDERHRFHNYRVDEPIVQVIIAGGKLVVESSADCVDVCDMFLLTSLNTGKFSTLQEAMGFLEGIVTPILQRLEIQPRKSFLSLVFHDLLNRTELLALCDLFLNVLAFRGLLLTPYSLALAIGAIAPSCTIVNVYEDYTEVSFVDDFWVVDGFCASRKSNPGFILCDSEDFVDEFNRIRSYDENNLFVCRTCDHKDDSRAKIEEHIKSAHEGAGELFEYKGPGDDVYGAIAERMILVFSKDKMKRIGGRIFVVNHQEKRLDEARLLAAMREIEVESKVVYPENIDNTILSGMATFSELECSKEMWMTDREWNSVGLRVLKEKILFVL
jgi:hypothetical protein